MPDKQTIYTTQQHLELEDIIEDLVILKSGNAVVVIQTNAVNFDLLSETEQDAMIFAYAGLLNALTFPIQVVIRSKRTDISSYITKLDDAKNSQMNPRLAAQISRYTQFVKELIARNNVLDKRFYIIIPFYEIKLSTANPFAFGNSVNKKFTGDKLALLGRAKISLQPKVEFVIKQLARIGLQGEQLLTQELVELFYDFYNADVSREQKVALSTSEYTAKFVEPAISMPMVNYTQPKAIGTNAPDENQAAPKPAGS